MSTFSDMPAELRNVLYAQLLQNERSSRPPNELALFTVSKQLHLESTSYFYQNNHITIDAPASGSGAADILPPLADRYLRYLRRLTVQTLTGRDNDRGVHKVSSVIASLATIGAKFDELNVIIFSPLSTFLNSRVDDSIMDLDHPITVALRQAVDSGVAKSMTVELRNAWFATGVSAVLHTRPDCRILVSAAHSQDSTASVERHLIGRYSSAHLTAIGLDHEDISDSGSCKSSVSSTPSSLPFSLCSAFADLDTFSIKAFEMDSNDENDLEGLDESFDDADTGEQPFFTDEDIEEWQASTQESQQEDLDVLETENLEDDDVEMEETTGDDIQAIMINLEEAAHHIANESDVAYMTNFAPDLLLSRHHLGHLV